MLSSLCLWSGTAVVCTAEYFFALVDDHVVGLKATMCRGCKTHRKDFGLEGKRGRRGYAIVLHFLAEQWRQDINITHDTTTTMLTRVSDDLTWRQTRRMVEGWFGVLWLGLTLGSIMGGARHVFRSNILQIWSGTCPMCTITPLRALKHLQPSINADHRSFSCTAVLLTLLPMPPLDERSARGKQEIEISDRVVLTAASSTLKTAYNREERKAGGWRVGRADGMDVGACAEWRGGRPIIRREVGWRVLRSGRWTTSRGCGREIRGWREDGRLEETRDLGMDSVGMNVCEAVVGVRVGAWMRSLGGESSGSQLAKRCRRRQHRSENKSWDSALKIFCKEMSLVQALHGLELDILVLKPTW
ncbi:hypothetical protein EDD18DRAFT_1338969 [Armillaria luteobubalina]|uniref:Uncharacterized protein n=1 Tax=Armillaria luteobubalina TaxID=153913 RepID=A0AA39P017_9AGAR|nr:hypothetical protein EDD18DRAFT_1338969 [Armillaria luteobubalina]